MSDVAADAVDPLLGRIFEKYKILEKVGKGGMGAVYRAEHHEIGKIVAIKVLLKEFAVNDILVQRFFNEARAVNKIKHDNIVDILDYGKTEDGWIYYVMEFLRGAELTKVIREAGYLTVPRALHILRQCVNALAACHENNIIHRDLKPDNIFLITHAGREDFVKLLDFGIAKLADEEGGHTRQGAVLGTPHYMSPEQANGKPVDARSDIYSLGIILYRMLTGKVPFPGKTFSEVIVKVLTEPAPSPRLFNTTLSVEIETVVLRAIAKKPSERYGSMAEFLEAFEAAAGLDPLHQDALASSGWLKTPAKLLARSQPELAAVNPKMARDGLPILPEDPASFPENTFSSSRQSVQAVQNTSQTSVPWLIAGISLGVLVSLAAVALLLWAFVFKEQDSASSVANATPPAAADKQLLPTSQAANTPTPIPTPNPTQNEGISLQSTPRSSVSRGKELLGTTPLLLKAPIDGEYTLSAFGYEPQTLSVREGQPLSVVTLQKKTWDDKSLLEMVKKLQNTNQEELASLIDPSAGLTFFQSNGAYGTIFGKSKDVDLSKVQDKLSVWKAEEIGDAKGKKVKIFKSALSGYDPNEETTIASWSCKAAELYCLMGWDGPDGYFYSKIYFGYVGEGFYLTKLLSYTGAINY